ncbi:MAG: hypothetical protein HOP04_04535 [Methylophilaceae bacterium]|nr:hypothetical protein [Methylophilaceae bacterium]
MRNHHVLLISIFTITLLGNSYLSFAEEIPIPRTMAGDKGRYFLLEKKKQGTTIITLHKRIGVDSVGYSKSEINCKSKQIRELGYSEDSAKAIKENSSKWFDLVAGSSKSDLAKFVCKG